MTSSNLIRKINSLFWGELLNSIMFPVVYFMWNDFSFKKLNLATTLIVLVLSLILLEGAFYWKLILNKLKRGKVISRYVVGKVYHKVKIINFFLLIFSAVVIIFNKSTSTKYQLAIQLFIYFCTWIENINYFYIRLS